MGVQCLILEKTLNFDEAEIKFTGDGTQGVFEGYASVFSHQDLDGDIILPGAFKHVLDKQKQKVAMFYNHRVWELPVGKWEYMEEDQKGLRVRGQLTPGHSAAQDLKAAMKHGTVDGLSIGFGCLRNDFERTPSGRILKTSPCYVKSVFVHFPLMTKHRFHHSRASMGY
ncbi:head maturation protease [Proteus mirabilis]|uniref:Head maturation protease n=1 Tax=Proteus mirabilis TaxID=584 RepID=A0A2X2BJ93_PROMI|nr:head maturation protease [Proteus mirabilis]